MFNRFFKSFSILLSAFAFASVVIPASAQVYNLAAGWSDVSNPNSVWSYGTMGSSLSFSSFPLHVNQYDNFDMPGAFTSNQPAWTDTLVTGANGTPQGIAKSIGVAQPDEDFPLGRVGGHTPLGSSYLAVKWTAPVAGTIDLTGDTWMWRNIGRVETLSLFKNSTPLFADVTIPSRATGINSSNTFTLDDAIVTAGGTVGSLRTISVGAGDTITFAARKSPNSTEDFVGLDFNINEIPSQTSAPDPGSLLTMLFGVIPGVLLLRRRRK